MVLKTYFKKVSDSVINCYYLETTNNLNENEILIINSIIKPNLKSIDRDKYVEIGPYTHIKTPWCSNTLSIFKKAGINNIKRIEKSRLILEKDFNREDVDSMLETIYKQPLEKFNDLDQEQNKSYIVKDIELENKKYNLGFDSQDLDYYKKLSNEIGRNFTNLELHDLSQSNSEHSRHWFFKGNLFKNGEKIQKTLFRMIKNTQNYTNDNSLIAFKDNASCIKGFKIKTIYPNKKGIYEEVEKIYNLTFTAETHNFPTGVAPFPGAATGTGGRIRDTQAIGRGGLVVAGMCGYSVGELDQSKSRFYKKNIKTLIDASNGASDYGNKFGEPVILGFCRSFGQYIDYLNRDSERVEWVKPIMFSAGIGQIDNDHLEKHLPKENYLIVKIGGPAYRIGLGGGSASSREHNTKNKNIDLNAVQRGDPEMENKMNKVIRSCIELGINNPILSIHDQGAGGTGNVTKEIIYPTGGKVYLNNIVKGDETMTPLELWISEYQEQNTLLIDNKDYSILESIAIRENVPITIFGNIENTGRIQVYENKDCNNKLVDLPLEPILGKSVPKKNYDLIEIEKINRQLILPKSSAFLGCTSPERDCDFPYNINLLDTIIKVFNLPSVGSKRFLTNKVDRSVTGLIAQQQCVGPLHTPLSNYAITAQSHFSLSGGVVAIGEQPIKGLIDPEKMARMTISEMLTNMVFAKITSINDIRCSGNWMWAINFEGEQNNLYKACRSMCNIVEKLGFAFDGGKDSLSMSYTDHKLNETIRSPSTLVVSGYAPTMDVRKKITPDLKKSNNEILFIDLTDKQRLGGSALAQVYDQVGDDSPDIDDLYLLKDVFNKIQKLIEEDKIVSGHDRSDGGLITTLCEMSFAGNKGLELFLPNVTNYIDYLFNEEIGLVIEVKPENTLEIIDLFDNNIYYLGKVINENKIKIMSRGTVILDESVTFLRKTWEEKSLELELEQCDFGCVVSEKLYLEQFTNPIYKSPTNTIDRNLQKKEFKVAIIREEGSNGEREMSSAFHMAGFETIDVNMNDILDEKINFNDISIRGVVFVGGFTYSDAMGAGNGWYNIIKHNSKIKKQLDTFYNRKDTFSLGVCNGCQLMVKLGWVPKHKLVKNVSNRFESRFPTVRINNSSSIMLDGMENSQLGVWIANGEGRFLLDSVKSCRPVLQYIDHNGKPTIEYPYNPNGSDLGTAAICSEDGRHLAMMPHPERCFLQWQLPYKTPTISEFDKFYSPWFLMFQNAYKWCLNNKL